MTQGVSSVGWVFAQDIERMRTWAQRIASNFHPQVAQASVVLGHRSRRSHF
jgi:hypothetical protein